MGMTEDFSGYSQNNISFSPIVLTKAVSEVVLSSLDVTNLQHSRQLLELIYQ